MSETITHTPIRLPIPMRQQPIADAVHTWLRHVTLTDVVNLWWLAQAEQATALEQAAARREAPDDMAYKSARYVEEYYSEQHESI